MWFRGIVACALFTVSLDVQATDYSVAGPLTFTVSDLPDGAGGAAGGKLVVPEGAGPFPLVVASHGWSASETNQEGWAQHFAGWGYVVVVPTFPNAFSPDTEVNAGIIKALAAMYTVPPTGSPAEGKVDPLRLALEGHSAGGLATAVAASELQPQATILFDPVDKDEAGKDALPSLCGPMLAIFADPGSCNDDGIWQEYEDIMSPYFRLGIPCPFLEQESCSIYAERPITCREFLVTSPAEHCARVDSAGVVRVRLPLRVFNAVARWNVPPSGHVRERWVPLILAPQWAEAHPAEPPPRPGTELLEEFLRHLSVKGESPEAE